MTNAVERRGDRAQGQAGGAQGGISGWRGEEGSRTDNGRSVGSGQGPGGRGGEVWWRSGAGFMLKGCRGWSGGWSA